MHTTITPFPYPHAPCTHNHHPLPHLTHAHAHSHTISLTPPSPSPTPMHMRPHHLTHTSHTTHIPYPCTHDHTISHAPLLHTHPDFHYLHHLTCTQISITFIISPTPTCITAIPHMHHHTNLHNLLAFPKSVRIKCESSNALDSKLTGLKPKLLHVRNTTLGHANEYSHIL